MNFYRDPNRSVRRAAALSLASLLALGGCRSLAPQYEQDERAAVASVADTFGMASKANNSNNRADAASAGNAGSDAECALCNPANLHLPDLHAGAGEEAYLRFALLRHPRVHAAFFRWWAQVEAITPARSLPDPMLTFEMDISNVVSSVMPGLMLDIPGWGKLEAMGKEAAAMSRVAYAQYVNALFETAREVRQTWILLHYTDTLLALRVELGNVVGQSAKIAQAQYGTGADGSLEMQNEMRSAKHRLLSEVTSLRRQQSAARVAFKAALGLDRAQPDPAWPEGPPTLMPLPTEDALWQQLLAANPRLEVMRLEVQAAISSAAVASKAGEPDFSAGLMSDVKMNPVMFRPQFAMTLPIWRDKVDSLLAAANAQAHAVAADLRAEELAMAVELAAMFYQIEDAEQRLKYLQAHEIPNLQRTLLSADAQYRVGDGDFTSLARLRMNELGVRMEEALAVRDYALAHTQVAYLIATSIPAEGLLDSTNH